MTEELEKKLSELLGMKKQLEELTTEKREINTSLMFEQYKKEARSSKIRLWVGLAIGFVFIEFGAIGFASTKLIVMGVDVTGPSQYVFGAVGVLLGIIIPITAKLGWHITQCKLSILQELKQMEMRVLDAIGKRESQT
jgi:hypothetical protein